MFGLGWSEMLVILAVALVVIGPKDMPRVLLAAGKTFRKIKVFTSDIQKSLDKILHEEELADITREANRAGDGSIELELERQRAVEEQRRRLADDAAQAANAADAKEDKNNAS